MTIYGHRATQELVNAMDKEDLMAKEKVKTQILQGQKAGYKLVYCEQSDSHKTE